MLGIRNLKSIRNRKAIQAIQEGAGWRRVSAVLLAAVTALSPLSVSAMTLTGNQDAAAVRASASLYVSGVTQTGDQDAAAVRASAPLYVSGVTQTGDPGTAEKAAAPEAVTENGREIQVHLAGNPGDPVPFNVMDRDTASLLRLISEGLVVFDENSEPAPGCAESWKVSKDGLQWTFTLREDLCWADGSSMEAKDFVTLFSKLADPATEALYGQDLSQNIAGYEEVLGGDTSALGVKAKDKHTLIVELTSPDPDFTRTCASWSLLPIREQIRDVDDKDAADWKSITGNGPYYIESIDPGQEYILKKNPNYHGDKTAFDTVRWIISGDINEEYSDFLNGGIDAISFIPGEEEKQLEADGMLREMTVSDTMGICYNCRKKALSDARVRRALSLACDRVFIASIILKDVYLPEGGDGEGEQGDVQNHLPEAKKLLEEAGYKNGNGFPALTCIADESGGAYLTAEYLASAWKDLGIKVRVESADAEDAAQEKTAGTFDIFCGSIFLSSDHLLSELAGFTSENENNISGFSSEKYDSLIAEASQTSNAEKYADDLKAAFAVLQKEVPVAPLASRCIRWLSREEYPGICCDSTGCWQLQDTEAAGQKSKNKARSEKDAADSAGTWIDTRRGGTPVKETGTGSSGATDSSEIEDESEKIAATAFLPQIGQVETTDREGKGFITFLKRLILSDNYFERTDETAYLTRQAWVLSKTKENAEKLVSLPKYSEVHLTGKGNEHYARITMDGKFRYLLVDRVTTDTARVEEEHAREEADLELKELLTGSMHPVKENELADRAADIHAETDKILEEIAHHEMIKTQTRNPNWNGPVLSRGRGSVMGPSGKETYYNLNMSGVVSIMRRMGNTDEYWVRDDGCKMLGDYIMCAANLSVHPRGSLVESSLGTCIVCDTGGFASRNAHQLDIAVTW